MTLAVKIALTAALLVWLLNSLPPAKARDAMWNKGLYVWGWRLWFAYRLALVAAVWWFL